MVDRYAKYTLNENAVYEFMNDESKSEGEKDLVVYLMDKLVEEEDMDERAKLVAGIHKTINCIEVISEL